MVARSLEGQSAALLEPRIRPPVGRALESGNPQKYRKPSGSELIATVSNGSLLTRISTFTPLASRYPLGMGSLRVIVDFLAGSLIHHLGELDGVPTMRLNDYVW